MTEIGTFYGESFLAQDTGDLYTELAPDTTPPVLKPSRPSVNVGPELFRAASLTVGLMITGAWQHASGTPLAIRTHATKAEAAVWVPRLSEHQARGAAAMRTFFRPVEPSPVEEPDPDHGF